mmetsp:Transcript_15981/g.32707  ORF Transcript_15981/g.32707 Transcript_15981/m.32707 type:complete len:93 (+) Transcript_15981:456-734(+)
MGPPCDPMNFWALYNGSLYCNYAMTPFLKWNASKDSMIVDGDAIWTGYYGGLSSGPFNTGCFADCFDTTCSCVEDCSNGGYCGNPTNTTTIQ